MTDLPPTQPDIAAKRFYIIGAVRIATIAVLLFGLAITQRVLDAPNWLGMVLAIGGALGFYFGPYWLAKKWRSDPSDSE